MLLSELRRALSPVLTEADGGDGEIRSVSNHSDRIGPRCLFCAIRGAKADGHHHLEEAERRGAAAFCIASDWHGYVPHSGPVLRVRDSYFAWGILCAEAAGRPSDSFRVHTVTGTNGKTTVAFVLRHLLRTAGFPAALISTVQFDTGRNPPEPSESTMPDAEHLQTLFQRIRSEGVKDAVMESSSHGLHQHRAGDIRFASAIFTNLTGDHLDYHKTMENYYQVKKSLFTEMLRPDAPAVIHTAGEYGKRLYRELGGRKFEFSTEHPGAFCYLRTFTPVADGSVLEFDLDGKHFRWHSPLRGEHNAANLLEAAAAGYALGIDPVLLQQGAESAPPAPGRLEPVRLRSGAPAFVDYAHTDDALIRVLDALRKILPEGGRLLAVFGCGGDRDRSKRPRMGRAVSERADFFIVTSDNPRSEKPEDIIREILPGIRPGSDYEIEPDRAAAILRAASLTGPRDILLVAGKGHETYQEIMGVKHPFDDRAMLRKAAGMDFSLIS